MENKKTTDDIYNALLISTFTSESGAKLLDIWKNTIIFNSDFDKNNPVEGTLSNVGKSDFIKHILRIVQLAKQQRGNND